MKGKYPLIGIFGHYGNRNLGDESIIEASIYQISKRLPEAKFVCYSLRPEDSVQRHGVPSRSIRYREGYADLYTPDKLPDSSILPWNLHIANKNSTETQSVRPGSAASPPSFLHRLKERLKAFPLTGGAIRLLLKLYHRFHYIGNEIQFLFRARHFLKNHDLIVMAGSNQFMDHFGGPWEFPYTLLKWTAMGRMTGTRVAFVSVGANPLQSRLSRLMIRLAIGLSDYVSFRDKPSYELVKSCGAKVKEVIYPDLAFGLKLPDLANHSDKGKLVIGINPMPVYDGRYWHQRDDSLYRAYVEKLAAIANKLAVCDYPFFFFPTMWRDDDVITDVLEAMEPDILQGLDKNRIVRGCEQVDQLIGVMSCADILVATRFHGTLLSLLLEVPVIGISYYRKNVDLLASMEQGRYSEQLEELTLDRFWQKLKLLETNLGSERDRIHRQSGRNRELVEQQWDQVLSIAGLIQGT